MRSICSGVVTPNRTPRLGNVSPKRMYRLSSRGAAGYVSQHGSVGWRRPGTTKRWCARWAKRPSYAQRNRCRAQGGCVVDTTGFDDGPHAAGVFDVSERVRLQDHDVGELARLEGAKAI